MKDQTGIPDVNVDQNESPQTSLLIIAKSTPALVTAIAFLNKRGVPARIAESMNHAIDLFSKGEANLALVSMNYPHPRPETLPGLLQQSFGVDSPVYGELSDRKTSKKLANCGSKNVLYGSVSGPVLLGRIRQLEKEAIQKANAEAQALRLGSTGDSTNKEQDQEIKIRGGGTQAAKEQELARFKAGSGAIKDESALAKLRSSINEIANDEEPDEKSKAADTGTIIQKGQGPGEMRSETQEGSRSSMKSAMQEGNGSADSHSAMQEGMGSGKKNSAIQEGAGIGGAFSEIEKRAPSKLMQLSQEQMVFNSILRNCVEQALITISGGSLQPSPPLSRFSTTTLLTLNSEQIKGTLLIVAGRTKVRPEDLLRRFEVALFSSLRSRGIDPEGGEQHSVELETSPFVHNAFKNLSEIAVGMDRQNEIAVTIVPMSRALPKIERHESHMRKIKLHEFQTDVPVDFDAYLHLKANGKYLRYLKPGASLSVDQKERLHSSQVADMFLNPEDEKAYRKFCATNALAGMYSEEAMAA